ncbi:hypothetical protein G6F50_013976 [Rhizopus delemar]|uniref:Uncharacterized protein n=1 Tax=Rhizopus delemar TaxID=936053 RepID=A0A9P7CA22_9FUNG|nr:hypothetical protein G6F50_013976 [Rhizopus delemar]
MTSSLRKKDDLSGARRTAGVGMAPRVRRGAGRSEPVARHQVISQACLGTAGVRVEAVFPAHPRRQAHQDAFAAATALQAEQRTAIVNKVEFHVAATAVQLELAFALAMGRVLALLHDRQVRLQEAIADRAQVIEIALEVAMQVVEEQAADAAVPRRRVCTGRVRPGASAARPRRTDRTGSGRSRRRTSWPPLRRRAVPGRSARWRGWSARRD